MGLVDSLSLQPSGCKFASGPEVARSWGALSDRERIGNEYTEEVSILWTVAQVATSLSPYHMECPTIMLWIKRRSLSHSRDLPLNHTPIPFLLCWDLGSSRLKETLERLRSPERTWELGMVVTAYSLNT